MNDLVVSKLRDLARLRQIQGANSFRVRAYSNAANIIAELDTEIEDASQLYAVDGIGEKVVAAVEEILETGTLDELGEFSALLEPIRELSKIPGIGTKRAMKFVEMGIKTIPDLRKAVAERRVKGGKKLMDSIAFAEMETTGRIPVEFISEVANTIKLRLRKLKAVQKVEITGSFRRGRPTVKDVDILVCSFHPAEVVEEFLKMGDEIESGDHKASIFAWYSVNNQPRRFRVDLMIVQERSWGAALCHFTGSKKHNIRLRAQAKGRGISVSQNGILGPNGEWLGGEEEEDLYRVLGYDYVKPEDREE